LEDKIPAEFKVDFVDKTIRKSFDRCVESKKTQILYASGNWSLGNFLSRPFFFIIKLLKKLR
jgi:hypothetical protein